MKVSKKAVTPFSLRKKLRKRVSKSLSLRERDLG
jgi:hypothetical protein